MTVLYLHYLIDEINIFLFELDHIDDINIFLFELDCLQQVQVRRLRIQQRIKSAELGIKEEQENELPNFPSFIPFLPPLVSFPFSFLWSKDLH